FLHQDQFGIRPLEFEGRAIQSSPSPAGQPRPIGTHVALEEIEALGLDAIPTGTVHRDAEPVSAPAAEQPYPGEEAVFELVYVAAGRAMIRDGSGFWVVQPGSRLPDGSRLVSIEKRDGNWVLVTSRQTVISLTR